MLFSGGDISSHEIFKHILSIGYEFETHDLAKLSLQDDNVLVNSDTLVGDLKVKSVQIDDNYYEIIEKNKFIEYFDNPIEEQGKTNDNYNVKMNFSTDITNNTDFQNNLKKVCKPIDKSKNDLYTFKTLKNNNEYKIHFSEGLLNNNLCYQFSGVEYIITYYYPKKSSNIILNTFFNACSLILNHLKSLENIPGKLLVNGKEEFGDLKKRYLFHKPNTNLFYLQINDDEKKTKQLNHIENISIIPQMTFRTNAIYLVSVIKEILHNSKGYEYHYEDVVKIEKCVEEFFDEYNKTAHFKFPLRNNDVKMAMNYLFLIFYKIYMYINYWLRDKSQGDYFKDFLIFASRHDNLILYENMKKILNKYIKAIEEDVYFTIIKLINKPEILKKIYFRKKNQPALLKKISDTKSKKFGNPEISFESYFQYFEVYKEDWFMSSGLDQYTTRFPLQSDGSVLIENRGFFQELHEYCKKETGTNLNRYPLIHLFNKVSQKLMKQKKVDDLNKYMWNPKTKKYIKKCKEGNVRNNKTYKCISIKS